jgi:hypothetical protein
MYPEEYRCSVEYASEPAGKRPADRIKKEQPDIWSCFRCLKSYLAAVPGSC